MSESNHADDEIRRVESRLRQEQLIQSSLSNGDSAWTIVYEDWHHAEDHGGRYIMLSQPSIRERVLADACWDLMKGDGTPGFSKSYEDGEQVTEYCRTGCGPDIEPLVIVQEFHGAVPDALLISEEFRLLMNLWLDPKTGDYYRIEDDGSRDLAIRISLSKIEIRTPILKRYLAARQLDAVVFVDSVVSEPIGDNHDYSHLDLERTVQDNFILSRNIGTLHREEIFSRVLAKRIIKAPPQQTCGLWPWDKVSASEYPEFIIGEDDYGRPIKYTCNPKELGNYFGANPGAPHYLTPVFFKPEVLQRYYDDTSLYSVKAGRLSCAHKWGVEIDNDTPGRVMVFLGDIGRDIPSAQWPHWLAHNVPPTGRVSESHFRRSILGQWVGSESPEHLFKISYRDLQNAWNENNGWTLYRSDEQQVSSALQRLRIPLNETETEFRDQLLNLALVLVDPLNEKKLTAELPKIDNEKGIAKLKRYLENHSYSHVDRDITLLQKIQKMRSLIAAHASGSSGQNLMKKELAEVSSSQFIADIMTKATQMMRDLAQLAQSDGSRRAMT